MFKHDLNSHTVSLTSVLKKFITGFSSSSLSSRLSSGWSFPFSLSGTVCSSGLDSVVAPTSGSVTGSDSCFTFAVSYMPPERMGLWGGCWSSRADMQAVSVLIAALRWEHNSNHASAYSGHCQQSGLLLMCVSHPSLIDIQQCVRVMPCEMLGKPTVLQCPYVWLIWFKMTSILKLFEFHNLEFCNATTIMQCLSNLFIFYFLTWLFFVYFIEKIIIICEKSIICEYTV